MGRGRSRPPGRAVEDPHAVQRQTGPLPPARPGAASRPRRPGAPGPGPAAAAPRRRGGTADGAGAGDRRPTRWKTRRATNCSKSGTVAPSSTGPAGMRNVAASSSSSADVRLVVCSCTAARNSSRAREALRRDRQVGVIEQVRSPDHQEEVLELRRAVGREHDPAVGGRLDRRHLDHPTGPPQRRPAGHLGEHRRVGRHRHRHAVEHRDVDVLAASRPQRRAGGHRGVRTGHPLAEPAAGGERGLARVVPAARSNRTRPGG